MNARTRTHAPDRTRRKILEAAFEEMHRYGFRATSLDAIAARAGVTKGALYHHFPDKAALGRTVVEEIIREPLLAAYLDPLRQALRQGAADPVRALQEALRRRADDFESGGVELGCPLNNLAQEMAPLDEDFRASLAVVFDAWTDELADGLARAKAQRILRRDVDPRRVAAFMVAAIEGSFGVAKAATSVALLRSNLELLADYLETLRAGAASRS